MKLPRAILADDHKILVEAFRKLLESHFEVVATVSDGHALLDVAPALKPDLILLDYSLPGLNGIEIWRRLRSMHAWHAGSSYVCPSRGMSVNEVGA